ncbi:hypothetical protein [Flagellimonas flava]|uniref:GOLD domain-containing protein n=1 Tax=Flagellimonas flava TaxID=570519 RepID=A0A1M5Q249_9FLAO|nr:hypothetical protein [Allomuricauda flava]SHH08032.1 hypothetical protein SAMN04488116_3477 [Allomuricauda flava]
MMKKAMVLLMLLGVAGLFSGCELDDGQNFHFTTLSIVDVTLPESFELNKTYDIEVTYVRPDACTFFEGFEVTRTGQTDRDVVVIGSVFTDEQACAQVIQEVSATFEFQVIYSGEYHFRFFSGRDTNDNANFLEFTVPVVE